MTNEPKAPSLPPSATAEGEELDAVERSASERDGRDPREQRAEPAYEELERMGWFQPESSAQKGAPRDEEEG